MTATPYDDRVRAVLALARTETVGDPADATIDRIHAVSRDGGVLAIAGGHALAAFLTAPERGTEDLRVAALLALAGADRPALVGYADDLRVRLVAEITARSSLPKPEEPDS
jgi:hypothetical protein